ncbi:unnamed protein product [Lathyrus sativus]|nr:unnamed protein product [Lathyrus sativus]
MVHPDNISKELVSTNDVSSNVQGVVVKLVDVNVNFNNKKEFDDRDSMLSWIRRTATKLDFGVVIGRSNNGSEIRNVFVTLLCERSGKYQTPLWKFKRDDTSSRKCECPFMVRGYMLSTKKWKFSVICGLHNHELFLKLQGHPSVCRLKSEEKTCISNMTLNLVQPKNILATLKRKKPDNISNIRQMYNIQYRANKAVKGDRSEMQQLLKLLDDKSYVSQYRTCNDRVTVQDVFWTHSVSIKLFKTFSTMLILDFTYKINKYRLPLFKMCHILIFNAKIPRLFCIVCIAYHVSHLAYYPIYQLK